MTEITAPGAVPPYVSFGTLINQLDRMEREGVPGRIDASYLVGMSGGTRSQFKVCLRSLGLIDEEDRATDVLVRLAKNPDERPGLLADILRGRFPSLVALNGNATRGQLEEIMSDYGLANPDTRRKAMGFYVAAATFAGFTVSPHLRPAKGINSPSAQRRSRPARKRSPASRRAAAPVVQATAGEHAEMRRAYFDLLLEQARESAEDKDLLDRIERLISSPADGKPTGGEDMT
jgi:hypothetical protein